MRVRAPGMHMEGSLLTKNCFGSMHSKPSLKVDLRWLKTYCNETSSTLVRCFLGLNACLDANDAAELFFSTGFVCD